VGSRGGCRYFWCFRCLGIFNVARDAALASLKQSKETQIADFNQQAKGIAKQAITGEMGAQLVAVNNRISNIKLVQGTEKNQVYTCEAESRPFEQYPGKVVAVIGLRPCTPRIEGATYFAVLDLSIPPAN
jgi:hypothetical protein